MVPIPPSRWCGPTDGLAPALADLLSGIVVAADLAQARELVRSYPELRVVTRQGDVLGAHWASGGSARPASELTLRSVADEAAAGLEAVEDRCKQAAEQLALAVDAEEQARQVVAKAQAALREVDAAAAEVSGRLGRLAGAARAARDEAQRLEDRHREGAPGARGEPGTVAGLEAEPGRSRSPAGRGRSWAPAGAGPRPGRTRTARSGTSPPGPGRTG